MPAHLKRKRAQGGAEPQPVATTTTAASASAAPAAPSRRATRQSSIPPLPVSQDPEPRRRRRRPDANGPPAEPPQPSRSPRGKENIPVHPKQLKPTTTTRLTRHSANQETAAVPAVPAAPRPSHTNVHYHTTSATIPLPGQTAPMAALDTRRPPRHGGRPSAADAFITHQQSVSVGRSKPIIMTTSVVPPGPNPTSKPNGAPGGVSRTADSAGQPDRNIDKVVLGDICFRAWYPSYYGKEVLGDNSGNSTKGGKEAKSNGHANGTTSTLHHHREGGNDPNGGKTGGRRDRDNHPPMLDRLYVCPCCFKYSKELVTWWEHVRWCERRGVVPGNKIYTHPKGKRTVLVPSGPAPKQGRGKRSSVGQKMVEEVVRDEGEWSIWEVDGETDVLFCQNLSLFAKLFLDNKSVFFDVTGFNYFLLVHTPPPPNTTTDNNTYNPPPQPRSQIVGFFSKEKLSWDNNNLACILIFPPWQRKGLGSLLMGISYEISRREGLLGGPEKPISDLGKKGYRRFWAGEIARWILGLSSTPTAPESDEGDDDQAAAAAAEGEAEAADQLVVDIDGCSQATWIAPEDCLLVLREMGVAEDAGSGPPLTAAAAARRVRESKAEDGAANGSGNAATAVAAASTDPAAAAAAATVEQMVPRTRISQAAVRAWVAANRVSLERACDPDGFVEGYAMKTSMAASEEPV